MPSTDKAPVEAPGLDNSVRRFEHVWGYCLRQASRSPGVAGLLHITPGKTTDDRTGIRRRSWIVVNGRAVIVCQQDDGPIEETELQLGIAHLAKPGWRHYLRGLTECDVLEVVL